MFLSDGEENPNGKENSPGPLPSIDKLSVVICQGLQEIGSRTFSGDTKIHKMENGDMVQRLRSQAALQEDPSLIPSTNMMANSHL